jgi:hypothetical protein
LYIDDNLFEEGGGSAGQSRRRGAVTKRLVLYREGWRGCFIKMAALKVTAFPAGSEMRMRVQFRVLTSWTNSRNGGISAKSGDNRSDYGAESNRAASCSLTISYQRLAGSEGVAGLSMSATAAAALPRTLFSICYQKRSPMCALFFSCARQGALTWR